jgi:hypothetical protein
VTGCRRVNKPVSQAGRGIQHSSTRGRRLPSSCFGPRPQVPGAPSRASWEMGDDLASRESHPSSATHAKIV